MTNISFVQTVNQLNTNQAHYRIISHNINLFGPLAHISLHVHFGLHNHRPQNFCSLGTGNVTCMLPVQGKIACAAVMLYLSDCVYLPNEYVKVVSQQVWVS